MGMVAGEHGCWGVVVIRCLRPSGLEHRPKLVVGVLFPREVHCPQVYWGMSRYGTNYPRLSSEYRYPILGNSVPYAGSGIDSGEGEGEAPDRARGTYKIPF